MVIADLNNDGKLDFAIGGGGHALDENGAGYRSSVAPNRDATNVD